MSQKDMYYQAFVARYKIGLLIRDHGIACIDASMFPQEYLYSNIGNYNITKGKAELITERSFDLQHLNLWVCDSLQESYVIVCDKKIKYTHHLGYLLSFNVTTTENMSLVKEENSGTFRKVTFSRIMDVYIITPIDRNEVIANLKTKMESYELNCSDVDFSEIIDRLEKKEISVRNASKEAILNAMKTSK